MRNPDRIDIILERLKRIWKEFPNLRLGQLIGNVIVSSNKLYFIEDEDFINELEEEYQELFKLVSSH